MARKSKKDITNPTEIVVVLDRSGSMELVKSDAIGGFNRFLEEQKKLPGKATFTLINFDHEIETIYNGVDISEVKPLDINTYVPRGMTALYDAIGKGVGVASRRGTDRKVIFAILTDGHENSSREVTRSQVNRMISNYETQGWAFIFLAAGFSQSEAENMSNVVGVRASNAMGFQSDDFGAAYSCASSATKSYRSTGTVASNWKDRQH